MRRDYGFFRGLLWVIGAYHILVGLLFNGPRAWLVAVGQRIGITRMPDEGVFYLAQPFGLYLLVFGVAMCAAAWNPVKNRTLITLGVVLFGLRVVQRLTSQTQAESLYGIGSARNLTMIGVVAAFGILLALFRLRLLKDAPAAADSGQG